LLMASSGEKRSRAPSKPAQGLSPPLRPPSPSKRGKGGSGVSRSHPGRAPPGPSRPAGNRAPAGRPTGRSTSAVARPKDFPPALVCRPRKEPLVLRRAPIAERERRCPPWLSPPTGARFSRSRASTCQGADARFPSTAAAACPAGKGFSLSTAGPAWATRRRSLDFGKAPARKRRADGRFREKHVT